MSRSPVTLVGSSSSHSISAPPPLLLLVLVVATVMFANVLDRRAPERPTIVIEEREESVQVTVGQYFEVRCRADGYPTPRISWTRLDNQPLPAEVVVQNGLLTFQQLTRQAAGTYVCRGINEGGQAQATITIIVEGTLPEPPSRPVDTITVTVSSYYYHPSIPSQ
ncbi:hypothetical protein HAZT_HAZT012061 [Hyalella azteca]|uniref:Ig-like domain-containing protein n=1 Tax=Hyalella azteca TaxID=294128 RepID=A0A6A0HBY8_HYAAZ|nr:hypothetical protein HAZT_HAZT012061 [Hyalella azteca]